MRSFRDIKRKARSTEDESAFVERLRELLEYDPETGELFWKRRPAGSLNSEGYTQVCVDGKIILSHRVGFALMTGRFPEDEIDHKNKSRADNRWKNLRESTRFQNMHNTGLLKANTSGYRGVSQIKGTEKWSARIVVGGKSHWLGSYSNIEDAARAYADAKRRLVGEDE